MINLKDYNRLACQGYKYPRLAALEVTESPAPRAYYLQVFCFTGGYFPASYKSFPLESIPVDKCWAVKCLLVKLPPIFLPSVCFFHA